MYPGLGSMFTGLCARGMKGFGFPRCPQWFRSGEGCSALGPGVISHGVEPQDVKPQKDLMSHQV